MSRIIVLISVLLFNSTLTVVRGQGETNVTTMLGLFPISIPDGSAIVLMDGDSIGIAILREQSVKPETLAFDWFLRTDGQINFRPKTKAVRKGSKENVSSITFGPFSTEWSSNGNGRGFIYLNNNYYTGVIIDPDTQKLNFGLLNLIMIKNANAETMTPQVDLRYLY